MKIIITLFILLGAPYFIYLYAQKRNMNAALWFFVSLFLPLIGWIVFFAAAMKHPVTANHVNYKPIGYRSKSKGKILLASITYLCFASVIAAAASGASTSNQTHVADSTVKPVASPKTTAAAANTPSSTQVAVETPIPSESPAPTADGAITTAAETLTDGKIINAKIVNVVDGDTMDVEFGNRKERIRLLLVDTPETVDPSKPVELFGPEASKFAHETLDGKDVKLEIDVSERDKYGRLLCYLWIGEKMFNEMLLEKGLARVAYVYPPNIKYVDKFREIQKKPQTDGIGIWSIENYAQEDGYHDAAAQKQTVSPAPTPSKTPTEKPSTNSTVYYKNCTEVKAAGAAPIYEGEPGYSGKLDRDGDGVACEK